MLFDPFEFFLRQHYIDRIFQPQHGIGIEARQRHLSDTTGPF